MAQANESPIKLYSKREKIYPKRVSGRYRNLKWIAMIITLSVYYVVPFIRWDRGTGAPDQAVLIDLTRARAYWFFIEIWPQEVYILTGILIFAAVTLFFVTSLFGRVWCGYFCPQTVWTDLFIWVERLVQGDRIKRKKLTEGPLTFEKLWKKALTHLIWIAIAWCTAGSFVLYFNDAPTLVRSFLEFNVSPTVLTFIAGLTFSTYLMAGFAREQVCIYMCPYARFQSAMFDKDTLIIGYDFVRGEPRGHHKKNDTWEGRGHCIDCTACVQVCPTGIDIRKGLQMDCIACGLCVDACDNVMDKIGLPRGLIRYDSEKGLAKEQKAKLLRPRTIYYAIILSAVGMLILYGLGTRTLTEIHVMHDRNPVYVRLSDGKIRNGYEVKILNKTHQDRHYSLSVSDLENPEIQIKGAGDFSPLDLFVSADSVADYRVFISAEPQKNDRNSIIFRIEDLGSNITAKRKSIFVSR
ncbi:MAG: cytochrome c oxidase accessory protein CcoG [Alphaproteobacteria bacterium]|nr:cytochrome c oxidase accessory protein CcoG [Alphaproteobacteria bacterium]